MTRLEKKCIVGAAGMHGLLVVIVLAASAFQGEPPKQTITPINWVTMKVTDLPSVMAGNPEARPAPVKAQAPAAPAQPAAQPQPQPQPRSQPQPQREKVEPKSEPTKAESEPVHHKPRHEIDAELTPINENKSSWSVHKTTKSRIRKADDIKVDLGSTTKVHRKPTPNTSDESEARAEAAAQRAASQRLTQAYSSLANSISKGTSKAEVFDLPGQGGGPAFADYRSVLFSAYYNAWSCPQDVDNDLASVEVKIVVARSGSIISAEIVKRSSDSTLNRSVQRALEAVSKLPPFPEGASDEQRSFRLRFNLKAKQSLG